MQYLLSQDEYDKLADSKRQARILADDFKNRASNRLVVLLEAMQHFDHWQKKELVKVLREALLDTPVIYPPEKGLDKK